MPLPQSAQDVERLGGKIVLGAPARHVSQGAEGVTLQSDAGE